MTESLATLDGSMTEPDEFVQLDVRGLGGLICSISVPTTWTVRMVKMEIEQNTSIPVNEQKLLSELGEVLTNDETKVEGLLSDTQGSGIMLMLVRTLSPEVQRIIQKLETGDSNQREAAVNDLRAMGAKGALPALEHALTDASWFVCWKVCQVLVDFGEVDILAKGLADERQPVRMVCVRVLVGLKDKSVPVLEKSLSDERPIVRKEAAEAFGKLDCQLVPERVVKKLRLLVSSDTDPDVRVSALRTFSKVCPLPVSAEVVAEISRGLQDARPLVRRETVAALGQLGLANVVISDLVDVLAVDTDLEVRYQVLEEIRTCGGDAACAIPVLVEIFTKSDVASLRQRAVTTLGAVSRKDTSSSVRQLQEALVGDKDAGVRTEIAKTLGGFGPKASSSASALVDALKWDQSEVVRAWAAWALGNLRIDSDEGRQALENALSGGKYVRVRAAVALHHIGVPVEVALQIEARELLPPEDVPNFNLLPHEKVLNNSSHNESEELLEAGRTPHKIRCCSVA